MALVRHFTRETGHGDNPGIRLAGDGKPYITGIEGLHFNISHSGDHVVAAFCDREVGIDIERHGRGGMAIAARFFHASEVAALLSVDEASRALLFADYWAIKESFLKYLGTGLRRPLSTFRVELAPGVISLHDAWGRLPLGVYRCAVAEGYSCFTCGEPGEIPLVREVTAGELYNKE